MIEAIKASPVITDIGIRHANRNRKKLVESKSLSPENLSVIC